ncbi:hypothetical protein CBFG_02690 [Clostridiales bacterium 1_7_47FAA]|nr:hypothetical protein CBFG_02690 [Clostridiales bacterium 1_7_47FAA]
MRYKNVVDKYPVILTMNGYVRYGELIMKEWGNRGGGLFRFLTKIYFDGKYMTGYMT